MPLTKEDLLFMEECNLIPHANRAAKIETEDSEGAYLDSDDLIRLSKILFDYASIEKVTTPIGTDPEQSEYIDTIGNCANCGVEFHIHKIQHKKHADINLPGVGLIAQERIRQITEKKFNGIHDSAHENEELSIAACCYAYPPSAAYPGRLEEWPFEAESFKETPNDRIRELTKAGALIAAELDRLIEKSIKTRLHED